ncbi:MAG: ATP-binding protein [Nannocystaceae bacterium]
MGSTMAVNFAGAPPGIELTDAIAGSADAMLLLDRHGVIQFANPAAAALLRRDSSELLGVALERMLRHEPGVGHGVVDAPLTGGSRVHATVELPGGETLPIELSLSPLGGDPPTGYLAVCRDASERERLEAQLRQAQKMEAIGRLAGGIAHDLNNVLTVVRSFGELALEESAPESSVAEYLTQVLKAASRSERLTRELLAFSRRQPVAPKVLSWNDVVRDTEVMMRRLAGEAIEFHLDLEPAPWSVRLDPTHFGQVLLNLVVNARDAMEQRGSLSIATANVELDAAYAAAHGVELPEGDYAMLSVTDTGCGIPVELRARIFEPFFTTKDRDRGTGLGLSTCYGIVKQAGGVIWVYSEIGIGTTFKIYLPRAQAPASEPRPRPAPAVRRGGHETLLVVEDDALVRRVVADTLTRQGYRVLTAQHGMEALDTLARHGDGIDLLVSDVVMPKMSGPELAQELRRRWPELRVLFMSGYSEHAIVRDGAIGEHESLLEKPFSRDRLLERVRSLLDAQR